MPATPSRQTGVRAGSLGADLVQQRLEFRIRRLDAAHSALSTRVEYYNARGASVPNPLRHALADFARAAAEARRELAAIPVRSPRWT